VIAKSSYAVRIPGEYKVFGDTIRIYRDAVAFLVRVCDGRYAEWSGLGGHEKAHFVERLVHRTKNNTPEYGFDAEFPKYPSYYRRAAIAEAIGIVSSHRSNLANWEAGGRKGRRPALSARHASAPALYHSGSFVRTGAYEAKVKVYRRGDWVWHDVRLKKGDMDYIMRRSGGAAISAPTMERRHKRYGLRFMLKQEVRLPCEARAIVAVDLGVNNAATMCAMLPDGTVAGRRVVSLPAEKDRLGKAIGHIKKAQQNGNPRTPRLWAYANGANADISRKTAAAIIAFAIESGADAIVFEALDMRGRIRGRTKQRLHLWRKREVQRIVGLHAHLNGMRVSRVCAWNTSRLAFDGSGPVRRGREIGAGHGTCEFASGKRYSADLNAAYNIGARYYIRETLKSLPATAGSGGTAKAPIPPDRLHGLPPASRRTLSDLVGLSVGLVPHAA
jgi:IS605 OrfB family transposase